MKYAVCPWLFTDTMTQLYGATATKDGRRFCLSRDNKPLLFDTEEEAQDFVKEINSLPRCGVCGKPMTLAEAKAHDPKLGDCCAAHFDNE
ncbi:hypothetical protein [Pseudodesulfovibrio indicus]|uniref:Uncharacterized protein n=1 Tax=Pseudodesulfovibrio indicus TaxID=1716143 RepID=A0AA94TKF5_9BACT|nr:hypothetical protein [Pseudodesulfovibrio indicus]TDT91868.1 hypothetical protein EDC59_101271 [Pseudodesulfovibrio indicus]